MHLLLPPPGYWYISCFFLAGPGLLHDIAVLGVSSRFGRVITFSFPPLLNPPNTCKHLFSFTLFLGASLSLISIISFTAVVSPKRLYGWYFFSVSSYILPYFLDYAIPPYSTSPFCYFLPYGSTSYGWRPLLFVFLISYFHFDFLTPHFDF